MLQSFQAQPARFCDPVNVVPPYTLAGLQYSHPFEYPHGVAHLRIGCVLYPSLKNEVRCDPPGGGLVSKPKRNLQ